MTVFFSGISRALLRTCALFLCIACASFGAPSIAHSGMIPPVMRASSVPLLPDLQYFIDVTGTMDVEEAAAPANSQMFKPLDVKALPRVAGVMWLRFTLAPLPAGGRSQAMLLDLGADIPADPVLYEPAPTPLGDGVEWREILPAHRNVLLLPEPGPEAVACYIRLDGLPGLWFSPMLRTPQDAATNLGSLSGTAALLALGVVMLLCLLRGLSERGQWRVWTALYVGVALLQGVLGMPAYGSGHITLTQALAVLAPGLALMLLPHVGRHLMRTRGRSPLLDAQFVLLSLPGAALALLPLLPGFGWSIRYISLWPACTAIFSLSALGGAVMGLGGARRFLLGCLVPPLFVVAGVMGLDYGYAANLLASAPLWGTALSALLIAGTGLPRDIAQTEASSKTGKGASSKREPATSTRKSIAGLDAALVSSGLDDGPINLEAPLDDPNLRLLPPSATAKTAADFSALPVDISDNAEPAPHAARAKNQKSTAASADPGMWENMLRPPLDRLMREGAALSHCSLPPAVRQYAENMLGAAGDMAKIIDNPGQTLEQSSVGEPRTPFNLQHLVREAHDGVAAAAENAGIGLAWYMPPLLGHMYEGQARALRETLGMLLESAVRATTRGAVHLSVRRVPETVDPGHLLFTVADTGAGIPPRDRSSLALTRAWELAGSNNGYLNVEYGPQGSSIAFTLRLKPLELAENAEPAAPQARTPNIAVVAESAVNRQALAHMIDNLGCNSTESRSMHEALQCNREAPAFMLVTQYPQHGAAEADALGRFEAEALESGLPVFKAMAITKDDKNWDSLAETGYTHALLEPVDTEAFAATLREVLDEAGFSGKQPANTSAEAMSAMPTDTMTADAGETLAMQPLDDLPLAARQDSLPDDALGMDARPAQQPEQNRLPDLFGQDAPAGDMPLLDLQQADSAPVAGDALQMASPEAPLSFSAQEQPELTRPLTDQGEILLPLMSDAAAAADDQAPIELTDLLPAENAGEDAGLRLSLQDDAPADTVAAEAAVDQPEQAAASAPEITPDVAADLAEDLAALAPTASQQDARLDIRADASHDVQPENESAIAPETPEALPEELPEKLPAQAENAAAQAGVGSADEFLASAGLEGPHWAAEFPSKDAAASEAPADLAALGDEAAEVLTPAPVDAATAQAAAEASFAPEQPASQTANPSDNPFAYGYASGPAEEQTPAPAAHSVTADKAEPAAEFAGAVGLDAIEWPDPGAQANQQDKQQTSPFAPLKGGVTPAEFIEAALPAQPGMPAAPEAEQPEPPLPAPAGQTETENTDSLRAMTGRAGEATLSPVNATGGTAARKEDFDVPAPAGRGAWDNYSLHEEWVGEPMPLGTPVPTARVLPEQADRAAAQAVGKPVTEPPARGAATVAQARETQKTYVSPSLAHPGEWVGEPMPMTKPAKQEEPAPQHADDRRNRPVEMPRTATGRLILKLLGSAGDRPVAEGQDQTSDKPDLMADLAAMPEQNTPAPSTPAAAEPAAPAEPRRAATQLKGNGAGNSIMNFIAGAAEALRHTNHEAQPEADRPAEAAPAPAQQPFAPAAAPSAALVTPNTPRETDQTIPQLVARLDSAMDDAQQGFKNRRCAVVGDAANRIASESDAFGFRVLARMARCVERAAKANDMNALRDLLPELAVAVERNRIGLTPRR